MDATTYAEPDAETDSKSDADQTARTSTQTKITLQGVNSINDFWCYLNGDRSKAYVASGDGVKQPQIPWDTGDFIEVNVRYFLQDFKLVKLTYADYSKFSRLLIVRDHRQTDPPKYNYYFCDLLHTAQA